MDHHLAHDLRAAAIQEWPTIVTRSEASPRERARVLWSLTADARCRRLTTKDDWMELLSMYTEGVEDARVLDVLTHWPHQERVHPDRMVWRRVYRRLLEALAAERPAWLERVAESLEGERAAYIRLVLFAAGVRDAVDDADLEHVVSRWVASADVYAAWCEPYRERVGLERWNRLMLDLAGRGWLGMWRRVTPLMAEASGEELLAIAKAHSAHGGDALAAGLRRHPELMGALEALMGDMSTRSQGTLHVAVPLAYALMCIDRGEDVPERLDPAWERYLGEHGAHANVPMAEVLRAMPLTRSRALLMGKMRGRSARMLAGCTSDDVIIDWLVSYLRTASNAWFEQYAVGIAMAGPKADLLAEELLSARSERMVNALAVEIAGIRGRTELLAGALGHSSKGVREHASRLLARAGEGAFTHLEPKLVERRKTTRAAALATLWAMPSGVRRDFAAHALGSVERADVRGELEAALRPPTPLELAVEGWATLSNDDRKHFRTVWSYLYKFDRVEDPGLLERRDPVFWIGGLKALSRGVGADAAYAFWRRCALEADGAPWPLHVWGLVWGYTTLTETAREGYDLSTLGDQRWEPTRAMARDSKARLPMLEHLLTHDDPHAVPLLLEGLHGGAKPIREGCVALLETCGAEAVGALVECLQGGKKVVRLGVAQALAAIGSPTALAGLEAASAREKDAEVSEALKVAMARSR